MFANYNDGRSRFLSHWRDVPMKNYCTKIFRSSKLYLSTHIIVFQCFEIGNFRVPKTLTFKTMPLCRKALLWKWVLFAREWKIHKISDTMALHLVSLWNRGLREQKDTLYWPLYSSTRNPERFPFCLQQWYVVKELKELHFIFQKKGRLKTCRLIFVPTSFPGNPGKEVGLGPVYMEWGTPV